jgi:glucose/arabinose dehydrogenase
MRRQNTNKKLNRSARHCLTAVRSAVEALEPRHLLAFSFTSTAPFNGQWNSSTTGNITLTADRALNADTVNATTVLLTDANNAPIAATVSYNTSTRQIVIDPAATLATSNAFVNVRVIGQTAGVFAADGQGLDDDYRFSFSTGKPGFQEQTLLGSNRITNPTVLRFAPDGRVFVAEKSGIIRVFSSIEDTGNGTVVADLRTQVHNYWDRGLLGMALHPNFPQTPYIYVLYTYDAAIGGTAPRNGVAGATNDPDVPNGANSGLAVASGRLSRLTISGNTMVPGSETVLINDWNQNFPSHSIGDLQFGPDGFLYASGGDGASFSFVDTGSAGGNPFNEAANSRGALRVQSLLNTTGPTSLSGTVIRINPDTGAAAPGNPYVGQSGRDANAQRAIASGLRNPYRFAFRPSENALYISDVGWTEWEEINRLPTSGFTANTNTNFGWPAWEGPNVQQGYAATNNPTLTYLYNNPSLHTQPFYAYRHSEQVVPGSGEPTGGSAVTGITFYPNAGIYPTSMQGAMFFADYSRNRMYVMTVGPDGKINPASRQVFSTVNNIANLTVGPDGRLYYVNIWGNSIVRFNFTGTNRPPVADISADRTSGGVPLTVNFSAAGSSDPDPGQTLTYAWDLDGDGDFDDATGITARFTYLVADNYNVRLRVTDSLGLSEIAFVRISAANTPPVARIDSPAIGADWFVGQTINLAGSATDAEQGNLPGTSLRWDVLLVHGNEIDPNNTHLHAVTAFTGATGVTGATGSFTAPDHPWPSWIELRLTATDAGGLTSVVTRRFDPRTIVANFTANPSGARIAVNGTTYTTPFNRTVIAGSTNTVEALSPQDINGQSYAFGNWNFVSGRSLTYIAPTSGGSNFLATFTLPPAPTAPSNFRVTAVDPWWVDLAWNDNSTNETAFQVERRDNGGAWAVVNSQITPNSVTYRDWSARPGNSYEYRVSALGTGASSAVSNTAAANTPAITPPPPSNLAVIVVAPNRIELAWRDNSTNEAFFVIQRRFGSEAWQNIATTTTDNVTYVDTTTIGNAVYTYRILSRNWAGDSAPSNEAVANTANVQLTPNPASNLTATAISTTRIDLNWFDNSTNETGFRIERRTGAAAFATIGTVNANIAAFSDTTAALGVTYDYRVVAFNTNGDAPVSNTVTLSTSNPNLPAAPSGLNASFTDWTVTLNWTDNANNETRYIVQRRAGLGSQWVNRTILTGNITQFVDIDVVPNATYLYRVIAGNALGNSTTSNEVTVTTRAVNYAYLPDSPADLRATAVSSTRVRLNWIDTSPNETGFKVQRRQGGEFADIATLPANSTSWDDTSVLPGQTYEYRINSFNAVATKFGYYYAVFITTPTTGTGATGDGLFATYFNNIDFTGTSVSRVDSRINFDWGTGSPDPAISPTTFSARYTGEIFIPVGGTYTFYTNSDDGTRLWVNNQLVIDRWQDQAPTEVASTALTLEGGRRYTIRLDYYNNAGGASNRLLWSGPNLAKAAIPSANLFSGQIGSVGQELNGTVIGTGGSWNNNGNTMDRVFDGNLATIYDAPFPIGWVGLDFGTARTINEVRYAPRIDLPTRMIGGRFQVSNDPNFASGVVDIGLINSAPTPNVLTRLAVNVPGTYRYARYISPDGGWGNIAELEFWGN